MAEPRYLLDTNILVYLITGASAELTARVDAEGDGRMVTSSLCVAEALAGERSEAEIDAVLAADIPGLAVEDWTA